MYSSSSRRITGMRRSSTSASASIWRTRSPGDPELLAHLTQRVFRASIQSEPRAQYLTLTWVEHAERCIEPLRQIGGPGRFAGF
jgi:hypothetical protein